MHLVFENKRMHLYSNKTNISTDIFVEIDTCRHCQAALLCFGSREHHVLKFGGLACPDASVTTPEVQPEALASLFN